MSSSLQFMIIVHVARNASHLKVACAHVLPSLEVSARIGSSYPQLGVMLLLPLLLLLLLLLAAASVAVTAAFQQRPFMTAAVFEAALRGAARGNKMTSTNIRIFASLGTNACLEVTDPTPKSSSSSSRDILTAAAADSSTQDAFLLQFGLITTQLKYATGSYDRMEVFTGLLHHVLLAARAVVAIAKLIEGSVGINSDLPDNGVSSSISSSGVSVNSNLPNNVSSSSSVEEQGVRVRAMLPWIHLTGRCLFFAGSQLLLAMEDPAAARAPSVDATAFGRMQEVSCC
jgi:hypothetical protein